MFDKYGVEFSPKGRTLKQFPTDFVGEYIIPNTVTKIAHHAFAGCHGQISIIIPKSVRTIGFAAFAGCHGLTSVIIPESVRTIGLAAFYGCDGLTSITLPANLKRIENGILYQCKNLEKVYCNVLDPKQVFIEKNTITHTKFFGVESQATLYVPKGTISAYKSLVPWKNFKSIKSIS